MRFTLRVGLLCVTLGAASCGHDGEPPPTAPTAPVVTVVPVAMSIAGKQASLGIGESQRLRAFVRYTDGTQEPPVRPVTWTSSNDAVVASWGDGVVVALSPGDATITAVSGTLSASSTFTAVHRGGDLRRIEGRILDFSTHAGVANLTLVFRRADPAGSMYAGTATTDGAGSYAIDLPAGDYDVEMAAFPPALLVVRVGSPAFRGDIYVNGGACIARYGTVIDATTYRPLAGATVSYGGATATTGTDGAYRIDHPCVGSVLGNTLMVEASHPEYLSSRRGSGRGISFVVRLDFALQPR